MNKIIVQIYLIEITQYCMNNAKLFIIILLYLLYFIIILLYLLLFIIIFILMLLDNKSY